MFHAKVKTFEGIVIQLLELLQLRHFDFKFQSFAFPLDPIQQTLNGEGVEDSVTRLSDILDFGQLFKAFCND